MHPDDVREYVEKSVGELKRMIDERPELAVTAIELTDTDLFIAVGLTQHAPVAVDKNVGAAIGVVKTILVPAGPGQYVERPVGRPVVAVPEVGETIDRELVLYLHCGDFDGKPPLAELLRPDRTPLPANEWPKDPELQGIVPNHPIYKRNFFCRPGFREFHEHEQHEDEPWDKYREQSSLGRIVVSLLYELKYRWTLQ